MKAEELRKKTKKGLRELLRKRQKSLAEIRLRMATDQVKDNSRVKKTRRDIARIKTILNEKS